MRRGRLALAGLWGVLLIWTWSAGAGPAAADDYYICNKPGSGAGTKEDPFGMADLPKADNKPTKPLTVLEPQIGLGWKVTLQSEHLRLHRQTTIELVLSGVQSHGYFGSEE